MNTGRSKKLSDLIAYLDAGAHQLARDNSMRVEPREACDSIPRWNPDRSVEPMPSLALPWSGPPVERIIRVRVQADDERNPAVLTAQLAPVADVGHARTCPQAAEATSVSCGHCLPR